MTSQVESFTSAGVFERDRDERKKKIAAFGSRDLLQTQLKVEEILAAAGIAKIHLDFLGGDGGAALIRRHGFVSRCHWDREASEKEDETRPTFKKFYSETDYNLISSNNLIN